MRGWAAPTACDPCGCEVVEEPKVLLCRVLPTLDAGGTAVPGTTQLIGADCKKYVLPSTSGETPFTGVPTATVSWVPGGVAGHAPQANVNVSANANQAIIVVGDGIYAPTLCSQVPGLPAAGPATPGLTSFVGSDCRLYTLPAYPPAFNLCASLAALPNAGPAVPGTTIFVGADCQRYTLPAYPAPVNVCATIQAFPLGGQATPGATLLVGADCQRYTIPGQAVFQPNNSSTVSWVLAGPFNHTPTANVIISAQPNNALVDNAGLYVPNLCSSLAGLPSSGNLAHGVELVGDNCTTYTFRIDPDACNSLQNRPGGLFVAELPTEIISDGFQPPVVAINNPGLGGTVCVPPGPQLIVIPQFTVTYTNPSNCRSVAIRPTFNTKARVQGIPDNVWQINHVWDTAIGIPPPILTNREIVAELITVFGPPGYVSGNTASRAIQVEGLVVPPGATLFMSYRVEACAGPFTASANNLIEVSSFVTWEGGFI